MTYDDVEQQNRNRRLRIPPWSDGPGEFLAQLVPSGLEDPITFHASSMMAAIVHAAEIWGTYQPGVRLRVTRSDGSEIYFGNLPH